MDCPGFAPGASENPRVGSSILSLATISFMSSSIRKGFDPTLDFVAATAAAGVTATATIGGYADAPTIVLSSTAELPPDEILARMNFGQSVTQLSALHIGQIAVAVAAISGVGGSGLNPLAAVQRTLGLDRLSISSSAGATPAASGVTSVEAGRYAWSRVFLSARQSSKCGTQALVQIDPTKRLKLQTALGVGSNTAQGATSENDPGNTVELSYQIQY